MAAEPNPPSISEALQARPLAEAAVRALAEQTAEAAAERAAIKAVELSFLLIGVDVHDKEQLARLRDDLAFLHRTNRGAREIKSAAIKTCVGAVLTGLSALLIFGFKDWIASFFK